MAGTSQYTHKPVIRGNTDHLKLNADSEMPPARVLKWSISELKQDNSGFEFLKEIN